MSSGHTSRWAGRLWWTCALVAALALLVAACGGSKRSDDKTPGTSPGTTGPGTPATVVDASECDPTTLTQGITGDTIKLGTSLPQSGSYSPFDNILKGERAYFEYLNANGGVTVAGKQYKIQLVDKDDAYDAAKTSTNVDQLINSDKVFALFNVVGTKNNLGIRETVNADCVPNLLIASGAVQWGNKDYPWMIGSELVPYPLEMRVLVDYLKENKPNATIALLYANDDFGKSYQETLRELVKGTELKIVKEASYNAEGSEVKAQVTDLASSKADVFVVGATLFACPNAFNAKNDAGWKPITYVSGTCASKLLMTAGGDGADGALTIAPLMDPADPRNDTVPAMKLYKEQVKKYEPSADVTNGIVAYGWTNAELLVEILKRSPKLDRVTVMETARTLKDVKGIGLQLAGSSWNTSADDWFLGETFQLVQWNKAKGYTEAVGELTVLDGQTAELSPQRLLNS
jgi:ABC-type branched-subunit amino acid transport system substrate-binding protein